MTTKQRGQAAGLFGAVALFSAFFSWLFITGRFEPAVWIQLAAGIGGIAAYLATNFDTIGQHITGRGTFFGLTSGAVAVLLAAGLAGINYIAVKKPKTWDLTKDNIYTLSDQTQGILKGLKDEVEVLAFFAPSEPESTELESRFRQYRQMTDRLKVSLLDPSKHLKEVKQRNISQSGPRIIVRAGAKESRAKDASEESLTNAIAEVTRGGSKKIYFSRGHGEHGISDATERGLKLFVDSLKSEGFQTAELVLAENKEMPADAQALVIAGPTVPLTEGEVKLVKEWVEKDGKLIAYVDPTVTSGLESALAAWGVRLGADEVIDPDSQNPQYALGVEYADHAITAPRSSPFQLETIFPFARSVSKAQQAPSGWTVVELVKTGSRAWGKVGVIRSGPVRFDPAQDLKGPVPIAVAATHGSGSSESRVVVVGNSLFAANGIYRFVGNRDFALNGVSWATHEEAKISIRPKSRSANHLFLSAEQKHTMTLFAFDLLPFSLLFVGLLVWRTRKSR